MKSPFWCWWWCWPVRPEARQGGGSRATRPARAAPGGKQTSAGRCDPFSPEVGPLRAATRGRKVGCARLQGHRPRCVIGYLGLCGLRGRARGAADIFVGAPPLSAMGPCAAPPWTGPKRSKVAVCQAPGTRQTGQCRKRQRRERLRSAHRRAGLRSAGRAAYLCCKPERRDERCACVESCAMCVLETQCTSSRLGSFASYPARNENGVQRHPQSRRRRAGTAAGRSCARTGHTTARMRGVWRLTCISLSATLVPCSACMARTASSWTEKFTNPTPRQTLVSGSHSTLTDMIAP